MTIVEAFYVIVLPASQWPKSIILDSGIRSFDPSSFSSGRFTYGRYCAGRFQWQINGQGWNSIYEYEEASNRGDNHPVVAVLGDSYLEGFYSNVDEHIDVFLTETLSDSVGFYTFAMSGGILSQYIALMKYEVEQYSPAAYLVFLNNNDVVKSIRQYGGQHPYYFQYSVDSSGVFTEHRPASESRAWWKDIILYSATVRYLRANAQVNLGGGGLADPNARVEEVSNQASSGSLSAELLSSAEFLLGELNKFDRPVLIVADCPKAWIYSDGDREDYDDVLAIREFIDEFENVNMIELADYYPQEYEHEASLFGHQDNPHWNAYANEFIAGILVSHVEELLEQAVLVEEN